MDHNSIAATDYKLHSHLRSNIHLFSRRNNSGSFSSFIIEKIMQNVSNDLETLQKSTSQEPPPNEQVWSILPLYQMYTTVVSKPLHSTSAAQEPPNYVDVSDLNMEGTPLSSQSLALENLIVDEAEDEWQNTVLDNVHKLQNVNDEALKIQIFFTKDVGESGKKPEFIDLSSKELKQGDQINGYFLVESTKPEKIQFEMFYVLFEGYFMINRNIAGQGGSSRTIYSKKFMEMFEFSSSWQYIHIDRLVSKQEFNNFEERDPLDNTRLYFGPRIIEPNTVYKRFFTFKIPHQNVDSSCKHALTSHIAISPSLGVPKYQQLENISKRKTISKDIFACTEDGKLRDFTFPNARNTYSITSRIIGKRARSKSTEASVTTSQGDEYIILKEKCQAVRIIAKTHPLTTIQRQQRNLNTKMWYNSFINTLDEHISVGEALVREVRKERSNNGVSIETLLSPISSLTTVPSHPIPAGIDNEIRKLRQLYQPKTKLKTPEGLTVEDRYKIFYPISKTSLTGSKTFLGTVAISVVRDPYIMNYIPLPQYRTGSVDDSSWKFTIPITFEFASEKNTSKTPVIKLISAEFVVLTIKSEKNIIPLPFSHDFLIDDGAIVENPPRLAVVYNSAFEKMAIRPIKNRAKKLGEIAKKLGKDMFLVDGNIMADIESMDLSTQYLNMLVESKAEMSDWKLSENGQTRKKEVSLNVDITTASLKGYDKTSDAAYNYSTFVPSFQSCSMARFYFVKVIITMQKHDVLVLNVPVEVVNEK